jgi:hypothetical protein
MSEVQGSTNPDKYIVFEPMLKQASGQILSKRPGCRLCLRKAGVNLESRRHGAPGASSPGPVAREM